MPCNYDSIGGYGPTDEISITDLLCKACKFLTFEQLKSIRCKEDELKGLYDWYLKNTVKDFRRNQKRGTAQEVEKNLDELTRLKVIYDKNQDRLYF